MSEIPLTEPENAPETEIDRRPKGDIRCRSDNNLGYEIKPNRDGVPVLAAFVVLVDKSGEPRDGYSRGISINLGAIRRRNVADRLLKGETVTLKDGQYWYWGE